MNSFVMLSSILVN